MDAKLLCEGNIWQGGGSDVLNIIIRQLVFPVSFLTGDPAPRPSALNGCGQCVAEMDFPPRLNCPYPWGSHDASQIQQPDIGSGMYLRSKRARTLAILIVCIRAYFLDTKGGMCYQNL